jgi:hypothetical protein
MAEMSAATLSLQPRRARPSRRLIVVVALLLVGAALSGCDFLPRAIPTEPPFCAPIVGLGSVQLDYDVQPLAPPSVSAAAAEAAARPAFGGGPGTACSVRLAKYDNISDHRSQVWVVHLDGLAIPGVGGPLALNGQTQPPSPVLRRALVLVSADGAPTPILVIALGH